MQVNWLELITLTAVAAVPPKLTVAPVLKLLPAIVAGVPPEAGPRTGLTTVTTGRSTTTTEFGFSGRA